MAYGNTHQAFNLIQNFWIVQNMKIVFHGLQAKLLYMTADAFFDPFSHPGITMPGKTKSIEELFE